MDVTKSIVAIRTHKGIKQAEMAEKLSVEQSYYSRLEKRGKKLSIEQLEEIATALGVSFMELITYGQETPVSSKSVKELEVENKTLMDRVDELEETIDLYKYMEVMRKEAIKANSQKIQNALETMESLEEPAQSLLKHLINFITSLAGGKLT